MQNQSHDPNIHTIRARPDRRCYGMGLGIIILDDVYPASPATSATPARIPSRSSTMWPRAWTSTPRRGGGQVALPGADPRLCAAAGAHGLPGDRGRVRLLRLLPARGRCGRPCAGRSCPVLLQVPFAQQLIGPNRVVGILMANANYLTEHHLTAGRRAARLELRGRGCYVGSAVRGVRPPVDRRPAQLIRRARTMKRPSGSS